MISSKKKRKQRHKKAEKVMKLSNGEQCNQRSRNELKKIKTQAKIDAAKIQRLHAFEIFKRK